MKDTRQDTKRPSTASRHLKAALGTLLILGLILAAPASADFEQVADFANSGEGEQLASATGIAVNVTGAGGVPAGTVYAVAGGSRNRVVRYSATGEFREAWGWGVGDMLPHFERCGPDGEPAYPNCLTGPLIGGDGAGQLRGLSGIAVNQSTGYVYVLSSERNHGIIQVFSADGSQLISSFGDHGAFGETSEEGPEKIHGSPTPGGIAVDSSGVLYVTDTQPPSGRSRVMVFEPASPGDYEHYLYTGQANDIADTGTGAIFPRRLAVDAAGNLYTSSEFDIAEYDPGQPNPICRYQLPAGGIWGTTVNPLTGAVFYLNRKDKKIHQLSACNQLGEFVETNTIEVTPKPTGTDDGFELAFNPIFVYQPSRPAGALYAADGRQTPIPIQGLGHIFAPAVESVPPAIEAESVSAVTSTTASLAAQINPKGQQTRYVFQYITEAAYEANEPGERFAGAVEAPLGGGVLTAGQQALAAAASLVGLSPDTEYHYRAIATHHCEPEEPENLCEDTGEDRIFHTFPAGAQELPDHRAYELVSPVLKNGGEVFPLNPGSASCGGECKPGKNAQLFPMQSSPDGEAFVYEGQPFSPTEGSNVYNQYIAKRTASGWQTTILAPALMGANLQGYRAFDPMLTQGILYQVTPSLTLEAPSEFANLYTQPTATPSSLTPLLDAEPPNRSPGDDDSTSLQLAYAGASADFSRHFFAANDALSAETPFAPKALDGGPGKKNLYEASNGELRLINVLPGNAATVPGAYFGAPAINVGNFDDSISDLSHAISEDGSRVFWSDQAGQVYVRVKGETTIEIPDPAKFLTASANGSKVLLRDGHIYDLETEAITDLSEGHGGFQGILGQSEDLSHVYFVDTAVLDGEGENQYGAKAQVGKYNLYAWQAGAGPTFVATLLAGDDKFVIGGDWHFASVQRTAQASPDGRWLAFGSRAPLSGYDDVGRCASPCSQVFFYDSATDELSCPSCNPSGQAPLGISQLPLAPQLSGESSLPQARYLTDEGRLYFDSTDSLTPFDTNDGVEDVYQYEPQGVGTCQREGGCVNLISAGHEPNDSNFQAIDATGKSVFFTTRDQLVPKDRDELFDLYVAREGGGLASETETGRGECQGEACVSAYSPPDDPTPGSSSFEGAGNVDEPRPVKCPKGKVQKKGKCVKKVRHERHKGKKHKHRAKRHQRKGKVRP